MDYRQSPIGPNPAQPATGDTGNPGRELPVLRWLRLWPYATASVIGLAIWFATAAVLAEMAPPAPPAIEWSGLLVGVAIGAPLAGLKGNRGWVVLPVIIIAFAAIIGGILAICGVRLA